MHFEFKDFVLINNLFFICVNSFSGEMTINFLVGENLAEEEEEQKMEKNVNLLEKLMMKIRKGINLLFILTIQFIAS